MCLKNSCLSSVHVSGKFIRKQLMSMKTPRQPWAALSADGGDVRK